MPIYKVEVEYGWTRYFRQTIEVEAPDETHARMDAIGIADGQWEKGVETGDGTASATEVIDITLIQPT